MNAPSTAELLLRMVVSLAIMGGLLCAVLRLAKGRRGRSLLGAVGASRLDAIEVRARRQLSRSATLTLVRVGQRTLLLGVAEGRVQVLAEGDELCAPSLDAPPLDAASMGTAGVDGEPARTRAPGADGSGPGRIAVIDALRELTVRR